MKFKCLDCSYCCFFSSIEETPTIFPWEKRLLEKEANRRGFRLRFKPSEVFINSEKVCAVTLYKWLLRGFCPFYSLLNKKCIIHSVKPLACKMYPLLLDLTNNKIIVSAKCKWIKIFTENIKSLKEDSIKRVFPKEYYSLFTVYIEYNNLLEALEKRGFYRVGNLTHCKRLIDADIAILGSQTWQRNIRE